MKEEILHLCVYSDLKFSCRNHGRSGTMLISTSILIYMKTNYSPGSEKHLIQKQRERERDVEEQITMKQQNGMDE